MTSPPLIGIDVGGTKVAGIAVVGTDVVAELRRPLHDGDLAGQVIAVARELAEQAGARPGAIGIAVPGQVDAERGVIELAVNLGVRDLPIGALVADALGVPSAVEHDARAVARWLADDDPAGRSLAYVSVGTGISAGVTVDGTVLRGAAGLAGEIGHLVADPAGVRCACGLVGCLETVASGPAIALSARRAVADGKPSVLSSSPTSEDVYRAAGEGDLLASAVVTRAATHLAAALRGLALAYGVGRIVIGGGVAQAGPAFADPLLAAVARERATSTLVARALGADAIEVIDDSRPIGALGAVALARRLVAGAAMPADVPYANPNQPAGAGGEVGTR
jgi:predicted NBD/HSP70 family sugar kinase